MLYSVINKEKGAVGERPRRRTGKKWATGAPPDVLVVVARTGRRILKVLTHVSACGVVPWSRQYRASAQVTMHQLGVPTSSTACEVAPIA